MNVSLTPELERLVEAKVQSGLYRSPSEVVEDALRLLEQRDSDLRNFAPEWMKGWQTWNAAMSRTAKNSCSGCSTS